MEDKVWYVVFSWETRHTELYLTRRLRAAWESSSTGVFRGRSKNAWLHAEPVGSARLAEYGRASLPFLSDPNILHINVQWSPFLVQPENCTQNERLPGAQRLASLLISCSVTVGVWKSKMTYVWGP